MDSVCTPMRTCISHKGVIKSTTSCSALLRLAQCASHNGPVPAILPTRNIPDIKDRFSVPVPKERLDELLLELVLIDTVALAEPRRGPVAERLIERVLSPSDYARVLDRYDELSDDEDDEAGLVDFFFQRAAMKDSHWKSKMLRWFMYIVGGGQGLSSEGLTEVAALAASMGASRGVPGPIQDAGR